MHFYDDGADRFKVWSSGDILADGQAINSDERLKRDITDATPKLADLKKLKVRNFYWKTDYHPNKQHKLIGFIAQELEEVFPALVSEGPSPIHAEADAGETRKSVKETALIPILVKAVQELSDKVDNLQSQIDELKSG